MSWGCYAMKLDRDINPDGKGKYALVKLRGELTEDEKYAFSVLQESGRLDWGNTIDSEFFVIRLKDKYAGAGLHAYARKAREDDAEYGEAVRQLADRAGPYHPNCQRPD